MLYFLPRNLWGCRNRTENGFVSDGLFSKKTDLLSSFLSVPSVEIFSNFHRRWIWKADFERDTSYQAAWRYSRRLLQCSLICNYLFFWLSRSGAFPILVHSIRFNSAWSKSADRSCLQVPKCVMIIIKRFHLFWLDCKEDKVFHTYFFKHSAENIRNMSCIL